jgi:L-ascorbate metabolism protein UlaG (beta-lactamase superfamily)
MRHSRCFGLLVPLLLTAMAACTAATPAPKITLYYAENAQFELISPQGTRILIDVFNPRALSSPATEKDVLLTTHAHGDHINSDFINAFPGQQLRIREGKINLPDVTIQGIASAHSASAEPMPENGSNYIFIVDMGGLRIVHFGDIGQDQLTPEQLGLLGKVDIAITQFDNPLSQMNITNKKGFNLMEQVKPRLIIPTHSSGYTIKHAATMWEVFCTDQRQVLIGRPDLTDKTRLLVMGDLAPAYKTLYDLPAW